MRDGEHVVCVQIHYLGLDNVLIFMGITRRKTTVFKNTFICPQLGFPSPPSDDIPVVLLRNPVIQAY